MKLFSILACALIATMAVAEMNLLPYGDLEHCASDVAPVWNRMGEPRGCDQWQACTDQPASGKVCLTTSSDQEFFLGGESPGGAMTVSCKVRAAQPETPVTVRFSCYDRLARKDQTESFKVGTAWQELRLPVKNAISGPCEVAVRADKPGAAIFLDDLALLTENAPVNPMREEKPIVTRPIDLLKLQAYGGKATSRSGKITLRAEGQGMASSGISFPKGELFDRSQVRVMAPQGPVPLQAGVLARWHGDGSIQALLLTMPLSTGVKQYTLEYGPNVKGAIADSVAVKPLRGGYDYAGGASRPSFQLSRSAGGPMGITWQKISRGNLFPVILDINGQPLAQMGETTIALERSGSLRDTFVIRTRYADADGKPAFASDMRVSVEDGRLHCQQSLTNISREPWLAIRGAGTRLSQPLAGVPVHRVGWYRDRKLGATEYTAAGAADMADPSRAGCMADQSIGVSVRDFTENYPCGLQNAREGLTVWAWSPLAPAVAWTQGLSKTMDFVFDFDSGQPQVYHTRNLPALHAPADWNCATGLFGYLMPPDEKTFPIFEKRLGGLATLANFAWQQKDARGLYGCFSYGDIPGDGGWANLETMGDHELLLHYFRTLSREHLDVARLAAEHYRDVDIHHGLGFCHSHCSNHTEAEEGWSHAWVQGLADVYFLTGDLRCLDALNEVGTRLMSKEYGFTTGRDWTRPIENLVDIYNATGEKRYLDCVLGHLKVLRDRQEPAKSICGAEKGSWYEDRYTCGSAFTWYGCLAMARLHQNLAGTGAGPEEKLVRETLLRELELSLDVATKGKRCFNYYPDQEVSELMRAEEVGIFALGRGSVVFPPIGYAYRLTNDRKYLDIGLKVLAFCLMNQRGTSDASATSFMTAFLREAKAAGMTAKDEAAAFQAARDFAWEQHPRTFQNGDLEQGSFVNWSVKKVPGQTFFYDDLVKVGYYLDDKVSHKGKYSLRLHSDNFSRFMSVTCKVALVPARRWKVTAWVKQDEGMNPGVGFAIREYDTDTGLGVPMRPTGQVEGDWREYAGEFVTLVRSVGTLTCSQRNGTGDVWFDSAAVTDLGPVYKLLTDNGLTQGRAGRLEGLLVRTDGSYTTNPKIGGGDEKDEVTIPFSRGSLTDGVSKLVYQNVERSTYSYWQTPKSSVTFTLDKPHAIREVRVYIHQGEVHQTASAALVDGQGKIIKQIEDPPAGWVVFDGLNLQADRVRLDFTRKNGGTYITLSEVEIWGE